MSLASMVASMMTSFFIFLRCVRILAVEQLREPIAVFWSLLAPVAFLALSAYHAGGFVLSPEQWVDKFGMGLAYVGITMSLFTFGMYLIGRRESGFVRSFLIRAVRRRRFVFVQYAASYFTLLTYGAIYGLISAFLVEGVQWQACLAIYGRFALFSAALMFGTICVAILPLTFQSASSVMSMLLMVFVVSGLAAFGMSDNSGFAYINPFNSGAKFIARGLASEILIAALIAQVLVLAVLGCAGLRWQKVNPEWSNR